MIKPITGSEGVIKPEFEKKVSAALVERNIQNLVSFFVSESVLCVDNAKIKSKKEFLSNGVISIEKDYVRSCYSGGKGTYQAQIKLFSSDTKNGVTVCYRLTGWLKIDYLAIGHSAEEGFRHVKIKNPRQNVWDEFTVGYADLIFGLQNGWRRFDPIRISDLRLYVKGSPGEHGATIDAAWGAVWYEDTASRPQWLYQVNNDFKPSKSSESLLDAINKYFTSCNPNIAEHVEQFLQTGDYPLTGKAKLAWPVDQPLPKSFKKSGTYRYLWHAMQPAISMMVYATETDTTASLFAARDYISSWLENSFFSPDPDTKYTWYDHGTAERLLAFLFMYDIGCKKKFDYRFMSRLKLAIFQHAQLLESDAFYAYHQPTRYHNHAWFQDMALIATAVAMPTFVCSNRWLDKGINRLNDQLNELIVRDCGFAIFVENSIGYHHGIQRLVDFAGELVRLSGRESEIPSIANELNAWSDYLRYPDGRCPSQGDTFRRPNTDKVYKGKPYEKPNVKILSNAGYAVVKGNHDNTPYMLCFFATSLSKTHKHEDNLSITLFFDGVEWLIDPSFYSHDYENKVPKYLRSSYAHNVLVIPERIYSIEPNKAFLNGRYQNNKFEIIGSHVSYSNCKISRKIIGEVTELAFQGVDRVEILENEFTPDDVYLVFHAGEGVSVKIVDQAIYLSHNSSEYNIKIDCFVGQVEVFHSQDRDASFCSVSGGGFMQANDTVSVVFRVPVDRNIEWNISAVQNYNGC